MNYKLLKLQFTTAVHFGTGGLTTTSNTLMADSLFSAMCTEAARAGGDPGVLIRAAREGRIRISDALPYIGDRYYIPKPLAEIVTEKEGDSSVKKALKKLTFLPADALERYVRGSLDIEQEATLLQHELGEEYLIEKAAVETGKETMPYAVALYRYKEGSGLYICLGYETEEDYYQFCDILELVSYSGIGGKISSGYGKFTIVPVNPSKDYVKRLQAKGSGQYMSLSVCLPSPEEMELVTSHSNFRLVKRSGWISTGAEPDTIRKRRDLYMFASGSVFKDRFHGCMCDLSDGGTHPVLRYGYPMLMGVN